jgi:DNA-cytosine methyltransferase
MNFGSVCSGIEAASVAWNSLGWRAQFVSENDLFPCEVLAHRHPDVPNLGDMTKFKEWPDATIDVLVGGTPCQSFSVAGLRKGLDDPRGNLMLTYLAIAARYRPEWLVWENVPGVLSDKTDAITLLLDALEELGYVVDIDILDAQWFGLAQRRQRVFVCAQRVECLINQQTDSSALTIAQCWQEILHGILVLASTALGNEPGNLESASLTKDGVMRRIKLFGLHGEPDNYPILRANLIAAFQRYQQEQRNSDARLGGNAKEPILDGLLTDSATDLPYTLTELSLVKALDESYEAMKSFTMLIGINSITAQTIYSCSSAVLLIAKLTAVLNHSSPCFWSAALSSLNALEEYISYATFASSDLFGDMERISAWRDFIGEAESTSAVIADIGIDCWGSVLPLAESLRGDSAPSRQARKDVAASLTSGSNPNSNAAGRRREDDVNLVGFGPAGFSGYSEGAGTLRSNGGDLGGGSETLLARTLLRGGRFDYKTETMVTHSLRAHGFDASEDGTGRGAPLTLAIRGRAGESTLECRDDGLANAILTPNGGRGGIGVGAVAFNARQDPISGPISGPIDTDGATQAVAFSREVASALTQNYGKQPDNSDTALGPNLIAFAQNQRDEIREMAVAGALAKEAGTKQQTYVYGGNNGKTQKTGPVEALRVLRECAGEEAFLQWSLGIFIAFWPTEILQFKMHGEGVRFASQPKRGLVNVALSRSQIGATWTVQDVWEAGCDGCPPQRFRPYEKFSRELGAYLSRLPYENSPPEEFMHCLWESDEGSGVLRKALSEIQKIRKSITQQSEPAHNGMQVRRLTVAECEALQGFPQGYTAITRANGKPAADGPRYKALGNSMAVPVMSWIGRRIQQCSEIA